MISLNPSTQLADIIDYLCVNGGTLTSGDMTLEYNNEAIQMRNKDGAIVSAIPIGVLSDIFGTIWTARYPADRVCPECGHRIAPWDIKQVNCGSEGRIWVYECPQCGLYVSGESLREFIENFDECIE